MYSSVVDLKSDRQHHTSNTVHVKQQKQTLTKGKNTVQLFTHGGGGGGGGGAMSELLHKSDSENTNAGDQNRCKQLITAEQTSGLHKFRQMSHGEHCRR